jgi:glucose/arabinose dehydrogenase
MNHSRLLAAAAALTLVARPAAAQRTECASDNGGIRLPSGFCASVFADSITPGPRHLRVMSNGDVYVSIGSRNQNGGVILLRDANRDGKSDAREDVVRGFATSDVAIFDNHLYTENGSAIFRFPIRPGQAAPTGPADTIVSGLPSAGGHRNKTFAISRDGFLYVNHGSSGNICAASSADQKAPPDPCPELTTRAGIWRFDARKSGQKQSDGVHFARGFRNAVGITMSPDNRLWATQHGRDALFQQWPNLFDAKYGAENPAEELAQINQGDDYGWPYCYYSLPEKKKVDAPEYGGDGKKTARCQDKKAPVAVYPGHWAPNDLTFYTGTMFPAKYRGGVFIAFHGSWNRAPESQAGFRVIFQPLRDGVAAGEYETFADQFSPENAGRQQGAPQVHRPSGVAVGPDGALYITDDTKGRIWKVVYTGR